MIEMLNAVHKANHSMEELRQDTKSVKIVPNEWDGTDQLVQCALMYFPSSPFHFITYRSH